MMTTASILIVEDESIIALDIRMQLQRMGYTVPAIVANGAAAINAVAAFQPDLILMDVRLQGEMDGIETAAQIQAQQDIPIIYLTAYADDLTLQRAQIGEPFGYILKPFAGRELHSAIQMALYRHRASRQIRDSEERYRRLFANAPDAILIVRDDQILLANEAAARLLYVPSAQDLRNQAITQFILDGYEHLAACDPQNEVTTPTLITLTRHDGAALYLERTAVTLPYQGQTAVQIMARDVTNRWLVAAAEQAQRTLATALLETAAKLSHSLHLDDVLEAVLAHIQEVVPHDSAAILLLDNEDVYVARLKAYPGTAAKAAAILAQRWPLATSTRLLTVARATEPVVLTDPVSWHNYLDVSWVQSYAIAPVRSKGALLGFIVLASQHKGNFADQSPQRLQAFANQVAIAIENAQLYQQLQTQAAELEQRVLARTAELEQERRRLQTILDTASEAIYLTDAQGVLQYANPATEQVTGYTLAELKEQINHLWQNQATPAHILQALTHALSTGSAWHGEVINQRKDGSMYDAALSFNPLHQQNGALEGFVYVQSDITHLKELHRLKDQFASQIGHELRTPVTNLKLYHDLLNRRPENLPRYLAVLVRETNRLEKLVEGFIEISALNADTTPLLLTSVDLNTLLQELAVAAQITAAARSLEINLQLAPSRPMALAHGLLINRALHKLLDNALNYTKPGGQISVSTAVTPQNGVAWATCIVHNTGQGIPLEERPYIFQQFYRGKIAQILGVPGAGLGLSICQTIVQRLNGRVAVTDPSTPGVTFTVWLPLASASLK